MPGDSSRMAGFGGFTPHLASVESTPEDAIGVSDESMTFSAPVINERSAHMPKPDDLSRSFTAFEQDSTLIAIIGMSLTSWLVPGIVPGIERHPLKKLDVDEEALLQLLHRWRDEAINAGRKITRMVLAFEAGRDGFWLARWLRARNIQAYVIHPNSVAVSREHRRAKTDRLDTELLKRAFLGWLRGESDHCGMAAIPTLREEDARRPNRERENLLGENAHRQSGESMPNSLRRAQLQAQAAQGAGASGGTSHTGRRTAAAEQFGRAALSNRIQIRPLFACKSDPF
jgi:hypothetical protein